MSTLQKSKTNRLKLTLYRYGFNVYQSKKVMIDFFLIFWTILSAIAMFYFGVLDGSVFNFKVHHFFTIKNTFWVLTTLAFYTNILIGITPGFLFIRSWIKNKKCPDPGTPFDSIFKYDESNLNWVEKIVLVNIIGFLFGYVFWMIVLYPIFGVFFVIKEVVKLSTKAFFQLFNGLIGLPKALPEKFKKMQKNLDYKNEQFFQNNSAIFAKKLREELPKSTQKRTQNRL